MTEEIINFYSETDFELSRAERFENWIKGIANSEDKKIGEVSFIFCDDEYLLKINQEYLNHDTYTDIISFDDSLGNKLGGDIFISIERVRENANEFGAEFEEELRRVMAHGLLHFCGYKDKSTEDVAIMREKEEEKMKMFHVEQ